jgi:putative transposase
MIGIIFARKISMADSTKFKNKYRIQTNRLAGYDYSQNGFYFVTICTKNREHYFGEIINEESDNAYLNSTAIGLIANEYWQSIPQHYPFTVLDEYIIMPNHLHGVIGIAKGELTKWKSNEFGIQSQNLAAIIRGFKSTVKQYANERNIDFHWQSRFHDHIIKDDKSMMAVRNYIINNPDNWYKDKDNLSGLKM